MAENSDTRLRILAIYGYLQETSMDKPITTSELTYRLEKDYHITVSRKTLYDDMACIEIYDPRFRKLSGRLKKPYRQNSYWLEKEWD